MQVLQENSNIPAFLGKLWKMVNDPNTDHLICWSQGGKTFIIQNQAKFWYELLPLYYKHNNMSSFIRQLNMYGFHKISSLENPGSVLADKEESYDIQFYHPFFQKDEPEKLRNIKRKSSTNPNTKAGVVRNDDLTKVFSDIKQLRGRQNSVDSQLSAMKQENAILWRELALLRQKHLKQQQIVNKLIQFLVTLVQPSNSQRMGVGTKRRMPLMLHENPIKKARARKNSRNSDCGPTIHELDPEVDLSPEELLKEAAVIEEDIPLIDSPITPSSQTAQESQETNPLNAQPQNVNNVKTIQQKTIPVESFWDKPDLVYMSEMNDDTTDNEEELIDTLQNNASDKVFINPNNRDSLIGNLMNTGTYNININPNYSGKTIQNGSKVSTGKQNANFINQPNMQIATKSPTVKITNREDLDVHLDGTMNELDQLKDILNGCNTFDANALLGLFADNEPDYGIRLSNEEDPTTKGDPLVSGNELTTTPNLIDFTDLFDDDLNQNGLLAVEPAILDNPKIVPDSSSTLNTPIVVKNEPSFPTIRGVP